MHCNGVWRDDIGRISAIRAYRDEEATWPGSRGNRTLGYPTFYDQAELDSLALSAHLALGDYSTAEYHAHRCLSALRPHIVRSRAITTTRLAHAQLAQGDPDAATATAM